ncbi:MAG: outer membrane beta-barrel family protein [Bacteroidales bacterium]|nr:outer membrane beta-barrel family protein [Bacteroidales bacterium]
MHKILLLALMLVMQYSAFAASVIIGKVVDAQTGEAIDYADVLVTDLNDKVVANAMVNNGNFTVENVPAGEVLLLVRLMGYDPYVSDKLTLRDGQTIDLGTIRLQVLATGLSEVTVTGEKNQIVYKLDRQRISGSSSVTASGGTAVDILANTPSVQVDADGGMTFRGSSNFLVYVDGKLSPLTGTQALQQIPAATIEDIELITTPSARYRADGDVGIINITTKRSTSDGWSGVVNASAGTRGTWSVDAQLNYRQGKHLWYVGETMSSIQNKSDFQQKKKTIVDDYITTSESDGERFSSNRSYIGKAGWQYNDGAHHNLALDLQVGETRNTRGGDMTYNELRMFKDEIINDNTYNSHDRYQLKKDLFQATLTYNWKINDRSSINAVSRFRYDWYSREYTESNMFDKTGARYEGTRGYEEEHHWDCDGSLTYINKYSSTGNLEAGYLYTTYSEHGEYNIKYWDREAQQFDWADDQHAPFYYRRQVHALYGMWNDKFGNFEFDAGLRAEHVIDYVNITIPGGNIDKTRLDWFPSAHISYNMDKGGIFTVGYSRRTNRPGIWQTEPYITYEDYYTRKIGSTDIRPEFIHSIEAGYRNSFEGGHSIAVTGFYRHRKDVVDWVREAYEPGVTLDRNVNAGRQIERGLEFSGVLKATSWYTTTLNGSLYNYDFKAQHVGCTDADGIGFQLGWINAISLGANSKMQLDGHYIGPKSLSQGEEHGYVYFDLAFRQTFAKGKLSLSAVASDIFHTAKYYNRRSTPTLNSETWVRPKYPKITVALSYSFNAGGSHKSATNSGALFEGSNF